MATPGFQLPTYDPNNPPYSPYGYNPSQYGGWDPNVQNGAMTSQMGFAPHGNEVDIDPNAPMEKIFAANRDTINTTGNTIGQEAGNLLNYYGPQQREYQNAENEALNKLQQTPGYTSDESSAITADPYAPYRSLSTGVDNEQGMLDAYGKNAGAQIGQQEQWSGDAAKAYGAGVSGASAGLRSGLDAAQSKFAPLDDAVNNPALGFDPNGTEKQLTDSDVNDLVTQAQTSTGNRFRTAEDTMERQAAAQGNTSPAAEAAMRQQLLTQEGSAAGDAATNARISALNAQYGRAAGIEGQREAATQAQTGLKATAATTEQAAAQAAAGQAGQADIGAQEAIGANTQNTANFSGEKAIDEANTYGQFSVGQQNTQTGQKYGAQSTAEQNSSNRAGTVANQRITGEGAYRSGVAQQQGMAQQGGESALQTQLGAYGTQSQGLNSNASSQGNFEVGKPSLGDTLGKSLGNVISNLFETGGVADTDMVAKVAEHEPEMVIPAGGGNVNAIMHEGVRGHGRYRRRQMPDADRFDVAA